MSAYAHIIKESVLEIPVWIYTFGYDIEVERDAWRRVQILSLIYTERFDNTMKEMELYQLWNKKELDDADLNAELAAISGDVEAISDRFYRSLEFGTGGLRGVIGAGTNRMNIYTVRQATQGIADWLNADYDNPRVAISYDSRIKSDLFAKEAARVLAANGVKVFLYAELMPTPCLSFAVRELKCQGGVMITASHNPAKYNGYKAYGSDGCQITLEVAEKVLDKISKVDLFDDVKLVDFDQAVADGKIEFISAEVTEKFLGHVLDCQIHPDVCKDAGLKVVYTPLNGAGNKPVREILKRIGIQEISIVKEQENPDGYFTTCPFPNPEITEALDLGLKQAIAEQADLLLATDPDCDRVGIAVPDQDGFRLVTGNEAGALLLDYICSQRTALGTMPERPIAVKTIVTTEIVEKIAEKYGVAIVDVLTGFKFIGEQIGWLEEKGEENRYIFGFEESYGYLSGTYVRDKDAVNASMLICEMAAFYRKQGKSLLERLNELYAEYGVYYHTQQSFVCEGESGMEEMAEAMKRLRNQPPVEINGFAVVGIEDYLKSTIVNLKTNETTDVTLPKSNVIAFRLENGARIVVRPSGTEPKVKAYYTTTADDWDAVKALDLALKEDFTRILGL